MKDIQKLIDTQRKAIDILEHNIGCHSVSDKNVILELEKVEDSLKELRDEKEFFMLVVKNSPKTPTFVHKSRELATIEANRLCRWFCNSVYILKIENVIEYKEVIEVKLEKTNPEAYFSHFPF